MAGLVALLATPSANARELGGAGGIITIGDEVFRLALFGSMAKLDPETMTGDILIIANVINAASDVVYRLSLQADRTEAGATPTEVVFRRARADARELTVALPTARIVFDYVGQPDGLMRTLGEEFQVDGRLSATAVEDGDPARTPLEVAAEFTFNVSGGGVFESLPWIPKSPRSD
ncbi:MAG: hypothetical protein AAF913_02850 [Pseudomonadota bacterium]